MEEGTLFNKLKSLKERHFNEKAASEKLDDILHALRYMHELEIAHRDIKP
jgi:serine/threonine protein kinase